MTERFFEPSVSKNIWGPAAWTTLHSFAAAYTPDKRDDFISFVRTFGTLLPCTSCVQHFYYLMEKFPIDMYLDTAEHLLFWTYAIHDMANRDISKQSPPWATVRMFYLGK